MKKRITKKTRKLSISLKIQVIASLVITILCSLIGFSFYHMIKAKQLNTVKTTVEEAASILSANIDSSLHDSFTKESIETDEYKQMQMLLVSFMEMKGIKYVYTLKPIANDSLQFIVSSDDYYTGDNCMDLTYDATPAITKALSGNIASDDEITADEWGQYISGYAPIYDNNKKVSAIVCIDYNAESIQETLNMTIKIILLCTLLLWILCVVLCYLLCCYLNRNLYSMITKLDELAETDGDLTRTIDVQTGDEFELMADSINGFLSKIRSVILNVNETTISVTEFSDNTKTYFNNTTGQVNTIFASMQNICATMEEMQSSMESIEASTDQVFKFLNGVQSETAKHESYSNGVMEHASKLKNDSLSSKDKTVQLIHEYKEKLLQQIEKSKSVSQINELTNGIISISSQTNLLSLNASIEAARAGEHGRGFSIVANEIGELADTSAKTAAQISQVNKVIIDAVEGFSELGTSIIDYLDTIILNDYDTMVSTAESYYADTSKFQEIMVEYQKQSMTLKEQFTGVLSSIQAITVALTENTEETTQVTAITQLLNEEVTVMEQQVLANQTILRNLEETLAFFRV